MASGGPFWMGDGALERAFRDEWTAVVAMAADRWPRDGIPPNPGGWLTVTAWRKAIDQLRRDGRHPRGAAEPDELPAVDDRAKGGSAMEDDRLSLIFACCHPALALEARIALTLRCVAGL